VVKVAIDEELHRVSFAKEQLSWAVVRPVLCDVLGPRSQRCSLVFNDDEDEEVTVSNTREFHDAILTCRECGLETLRLTVRPSPTPFGGAPIAAAVAAAAASPPPVDMAAPRGPARATRDRTELDETWVVVKPGHRFISDARLPPPQEQDYVPASLRTEFTPSSECRYTPALQRASYTPVARANASLAPPPTYDNVRAREISEEAAVAAISNVRRTSSFNTRSAQRAREYVPVSSSSEYLPAVLRTPSVPSQH